MMVDTSLQLCEQRGQPIRVGMIGAGATGRAIALQLATPVAGIRLVGIANRTLKNGERAFKESGISVWLTVTSARAAGTAIDLGIPVLTEDPTVLVGCDSVDLIVEATGTIDAAAVSVLAAIEHRKDVVLVNAELDSLLGPILKAKADEAGVVITHTDGDEPGVAMTLIRYLRTLGLRVVAAGNIKGIVDYYRNPETQRSFAERHGQDVRKVTSFADGTKLSMEATVLANATGFRAGRRGMYGPACDNVREIANLLPPEDMLEIGLVDYALGAAPHTGAFAITYEDSQLKRLQLSYYKLGGGPFYVFYTPFHLPHIQIASTIGRAFIHRDPTVAPIGGPICEVVTVAKRDLKARERLDGVGGFCTYGLIENAQAARVRSDLPIGLSEGCILRRDVSKDAVLSFEDVDMLANGIVKDLWREQFSRWQVAPIGTGASSQTNAQLT